MGRHVASVAARGVHGDVDAWVAAAVPRRSWDDALRALVRPYARTLALAGAQQEYNLVRRRRRGVLCRWLKRPPDPLSQRLELPDHAREAVERQAERVLDRPYWQDCNETVRESLVRHLQDGLDEGLSGDDMAAKVMEVLGPAASESRARRIARTETTGFLNAGQRGARRELEADGLVKGSEWLAILDRDTRDSHADAHGQQIAVNERFIVGGEECDHPGDPDLSAEERCNCRCTSVAVLADPDELPAPGEEPADSAPVTAPADGDDATADERQAAEAAAELSRVVADAVAEEGRRSRQELESLLSRAYLRDRWGGAKPSVEDDEGALPPGAPPMPGAGDRVKYDPDQPRVPAGSPEGGEWAGGGGGGGSGGGPAPTESRPAPRPSSATVGVEASSPEREAQVRDTVHRLFGRHLDKGALADVVGAPAGSHVIVRPWGKELRLEVQGNGFTAERHILPGKGDAGPEMFNNFLYLHPSLQGKGIGSDVFSSQVENARAMGVSKINTVAGRGPGENGYYTWPRLGYDAKLAGKYRDKLPESLKGADKLSDLVKTPEGRAWWRDNGGRQKMQFDLAAGSLSGRVHTAYLEERASRAKGEAPPLLGDAPAGWDVEQAPVLSAADEDALDRAWDRVARSKSAGAAVKYNQDQPRVPAGQPGGGQFGGGGGADGGGAGDSGGGGTPEPQTAGEAPPAATREEAHGALRTLASKSWEALKAAGHGAKAVEHAAKEWVSDKVGAAVGKLPERMQGLVKGTWRAVRLGLKGTFAGFTAGQALAERVSKARGSSPEQAARLRQTLSAIDVALYKPMQIGLGLAAGPAVSVPASFLPVGSMTYLAYAGSMAGARAAKGAVRSAARKIAGKAAPEFKSAEDFADHLAAEYERTGGSAWYFALYLHALDEAGDARRALAVAAVAWQDTGGVQAGE
jgi:GNAT superfamily N-acetyltransferase